MTAFRSALASTRMFLIMAVWLIAYLGVHLWPASFWFEVRTVQVQETLENTPILMVVDREIKRPFVAEWVATVRRVSPTKLEPFCSGSGRNDYSPVQDMPEVPTLEWWTGGKCPTLPAGDYIVDTVWTVEPSIPFLPYKHIRNTSNLFHICANPNCPRRPLEVPQ